MDERGISFDEALAEVEKVFGKERVEALKEKKMRLEALLEGFLP